MKKILTYLFVLAGIASANSVVVEPAGLNGNAATVMTVSGATLYIPEPATATLGLLALCGLASRRRRK